MNVLDELRQAFTGTPPAGTTAPAAGDLTDLTDLDELDELDEFDDLDDGTFDFTLDDLPLAEFDDLDGGSGPGAPGDLDGSAGGGRSGHGDAGLPADLPLAGGSDDSLFTLDGGPAAATHPPGTDHTGPWVVDTPDVRIIPKDRRPTPTRPIATDASAAGGPIGGPTPPSAAAAPRPTIVIGGDDSLPDAIYLDADEVSTAHRGGALSDTSARGTIVIGDELEASGAFDAVEVPSRSMDPRVRARRIAVKRAQGRRRLLWVAGVGGVVVVVVAVLAVFSSGLFAVERVDVQGAPYTQARYGDRMQAVIDEMLGEPVLLVDTKAAEETLEQLPWIERAFVTTDFPDRVLIDVRERQPLATFVGSDSRYRVIDRDGYVLDVLAGRPSNYMLVSGIGPDLEAGSAAGAQYGAAAQLVGALPAEIRSITVSATLDPTTGDLGLVVQRIVAPDPADPETIPAPGAEPTEPDLVEVRIGSFNGLDGKLARLLQLVRRGLDESGKVDVSTDDVIG